MTQSHVQCFCKVGVKRGKLRIEERWTQTQLNRGQEAKSGEKTKGELYKIKADGNKKSKEHGKINPGQKPK